jgi:hypothetical protein
MATIREPRVPERPRERPSALRSIIAGSTAGAVEIGMLHLILPAVILLISEYSDYISSRMYVCNWKFGTIWKVYN